MFSTFHMRHNLLVSSIHTRFQKSHPSLHMMPMSGWIAFSTKDNSFARFLYYIVVHIIDIYLPWIPFFIAMFSH